MMKRNVFAAWLAALALNLPGSAFAADDAAVAPAAPAAAHAAAPQADVPDDYRIGPADLLDISVFQAPELSRTVRVGGNGELSLPLIGQVQAGGLTGPQLEAVIAQKLQKNYLQNPQVSVFIKEFVSQRVTVGGSVNKAGVYPITGRTTLMQAIAMAGGLGDVASESGIRLYRQSSDGARQVLNFDLAPILSGQRPDPVLQTGDVVMVDKSAGRSAYKRFLETIPAIGILHLFL